jgi:hypothetical protein
MPSFDVQKWDYETDWLTDAFETLHGELLKPKKFNSDQWLNAFILLRENLESSIDNLDDSNPLAANSWLHTRPRLHLYHEVMVRNLEEMQEEWRCVTRPGVKMTEKHFRKNRAEFRMARNVLKRVWMEDLKLGVERLAAEGQDEGQVPARGLGITGKDGKNILNLFVLNRKDERSDIRTEKQRASELLQILMKIHKVQTKQEEDLGKSDEEKDGDLEGGEIVELTATIGDDEESEEEADHLEKNGSPLLLLAVAECEREQGL